MRVTIILLGFLLSIDCYADKWYPRDSVGGKPRNGAIAVSIPSIGKAYVGCGSDGLGGFLSDFWEFDPSTGKWKLVAHYPGNATVNSFAFSIGSKCYVGGGDVGGSMADDFWEYDPVKDKWTRMADLPAGRRSSPFSFSIGTTGYMGGGYNESWMPTSDFWAFDPQANRWTRKTDYAGGGTALGSGMATNGKGYVSLGLGVGSNAHNFFEYDPAANRWTVKANIDGPIYYRSAGFAVCGKIYLATGNAISTQYTDELWQYDPTINSWTSKADFMGGPRNQAVGFSLLEKGYIGTGGFGLSDWYQYSPDSCRPTGILDQHRYPTHVSVYPNPFRNELKFVTEAEDSLSLIIYDMSMHVVLRKRFVQSLTIDSKDLSQGLYIYELCSSKGDFLRGKLIKR